MTHRSHEKTKKPLEQEYFQYEDLFRAVNNAHPQRQGLFLEEYEQALSDPTTVCTEVATDTGDTVRVPQLAAIRNFEWLNNGFYEKTYGEQVVEDNLLYFVDVPGVKPSDMVLQHIMELAHRGGVLAFDTPSMDPGARDRVVSMLDSLGVKYAEPQLLGTQTYFAGQVKLKRATPSSAPLTLAQAYDKAAQEGVYPSTTEDGVVLQHIVDTQRALYMDEFYEDAYKVLNDHPCKQGLSPDEFLQMTVDEPEVDKIMVVKNGVAQSLYLTCNDLKKLSWVNTEYYQNQYPDKMAKGQVVWFPGIATDPRPEVAGHNSEVIIGLIADLVERGGNEMLVVFDFCDLNTAWLADHLNTLINNTPNASIDIKPIAEQKYWGLQLEAA